MIQATGSKSAVELVPYDKVFEKDFEDMQRRVPGLDKINEYIGFEPRTDLDTILQHTIEYMRNR